MKRVALLRVTSLGRGTTGMRRTSVKRARANVLYRTARALHLAAHPMCERCESAPAVLVHHKRGRAGGALTDRRFFAALCDACHRRTHANPVEAYTEGSLTRRTGEL